jgi:hypothetical protein
MSKELEPKIKELEEQMHRMEILTMAKSSPPMTKNEITELKTLLDNDELEIKKICKHYEINDISELSSDMGNCLNHNFRNVLRNLILHD